MNNGPAFILHTILNYSFSKRVTDIMKLFLLTLKTFTMRLRVSASMPKPLIYVQFIECLYTDPSDGEVVFIHCPSCKVQETICLIFVYRLKKIFF